MVTSKENSSSRDWLRMKFGVEEESSEDKEDNDMAIDKMMLYDGDIAGYGPGLVVLDLSPSSDKR